MHQLTASTHAPGAPPSPGTRDRVTGALTALAAIAALAALVLIAAVAARVVGPWQVGAVAIAVAALGLLHGGLAAWALPDGGLPARTVVALGLGLATAGIAVWVSGITGMFAARWVVLAIPVLGWLPARARSGWHAAAPWTWTARLRHAAPVLIALAVAWALAARSSYLYTAPLLTGGGQLTFYVDVPWHIALTAEALDRAPSVYPWIPDVPIGYSWLFFGSLGLLGNLSGADADSLVLVLGPAVLAVLVPAALASCTWVVARSRAAAAAAVLVWELGRGLLVGHVDGLLQTPQWVLINRDLTNALVLCTAVLFTTWVRRPAGRWAGPDVTVAGVVSAMLVFAVAASRGGAVLAVLGMALLTWAVLLRHGARAGAWAVALVVPVSVVAATAGVTRSSGSFGWDPMSFLPTSTVAGLELPVRGALSITLVLLVVLAASLAGRLLPPAAAPLLVVCGGVLAGVAGMALFGHPSFSQIYFFHAAWPLVVMAGAVALRVAVALIGWPVLVGWLITAVMAQVALGRVAQHVGPIPWPARAAVLASAAALTVLAVCWSLTRRGRRAPAPAGPLAGAVLAVSVLAFGVQPFSVPTVITPAVIASAEPGPASLDRAELALLHSLRDASDPDDLVATNRHCLSGTTAGVDCDARWFAVSAFAERRVLVEGWSYDYTWSSSGTDNLEPYWDAALLRLNDDFIGTPTAVGCTRLRAEGVRWIWADHGRPWSSDLARFGTLIGTTDRASLYRLTRCG